MKFSDLKVLDEAMNAIKEEIAKDLFESVNLEQSSQESALESLECN